MTFLFTTSNVTTSRTVLKQPELLEILSKENRIF